jgi:hypothetical protein
MRPGTIWIGVALVAIGVCGLLDATGVVASSQTIGAWWPLVIVGWALVDMGAARRVTLAGIIWTAVGTALLADCQQWASDVAVWSTLAAFVGVAILTAAVARRRDSDRSVPGGTRAVDGTPVNGGAS